MTLKKAKAKVLTVMFIDIVGYTKTTSQLRSEDFNQLHNIFDSISISIIEQHDGKIVKKIGDAFLITFNTPTEAIQCGIELQKAFRSYNKKHKPKHPLRIRVAIHSGEVLIRHYDVFGDTVNTAARIEGIAKSGEIVFSESTFLAMNKNEVPFIHLGLRKMKGLKYPIRVFKVRDKYLERKRAIRRQIRKIKKILFFLIIIVIIIILSYLFFRNLV